MRTRGVLEVVALDARLGVELRGDAEVRDVEPVVVVKVHVRLRTPDLRIATATVIEPVVVVGDARVVDEVYEVVVPAAEPGRAPVDVIVRERDVVVARRVAAADVDETVADLLDSQMIEPDVARAGEGDAVAGLDELPLPALFVPPISLSLPELPSLPELGLDCPFD